MDGKEIERLRALPLEEVLRSLGAARDPKDPAHNWRYGSSRITVTDARFYDHNAAGARHRMREGQSGGGGAIDLVQYLKNLDFRAAVRELGGLPAAPTASTALPRASVRAPATRPPPAPAPDRSVRAHWYLTEVRKLPSALVEEEMGRGAVFADTRGNVVFRLRNAAGAEVGYEVRGTFEKPYHSVHGEKGLFISRADATRAVAFVESGIEALSYRALQSRGLVVSTTGSAVDKPVALGRLLHARGFEVVAAFNRDKAGDRLAERLQEGLGREVRRDRPPAGLKDWNEVLVAQAALPRVPLDASHVR
jgi:hypothetical protein